MGAQGDLSMGLFAGAAGTLAVEASEQLEAAWLGERPLYSAKDVARRLFGGAVPGPALRWPYGVLLGAVAGRLLDGRRLGAVGEAVAVGGAVLAFELVAMPALGATPPLRAWPRRQLATLV